MNKNPKTHGDSTGRIPRESQIDRLIRRNASRPLAVWGKRLERINTGRRAFTREG